MTKQREALASSNLKKLRWMTGFIILGLILSGVTAFPLEAELRLLGHFAVGAEGSLSPADHRGLKHWILTVREGLINTYQAYPFIGYGTDWLAFGHVVIALFFIPVWKNPVRYRANLTMGLWASIGVFALAFIAGPIRGIPLGWQLIDCSFGLVAGTVFIVMLRMTPQSENL